MLNALLASQSAAPQAQNTFLLVQEIVDEPNYNRLTSNVQNLHTLCLGGSDKVRLIFTDEPPAAVSSKVFAGVDQNSKAMLVLLSDCALMPRAFSPKSSSA
jgi:hypothetical protein